ncbi:Rpn family recombination-promoting nuclease/putative transposase, partial [Microcoleus anatoxicus]
PKFTKTVDQLETLADKWLYFMKYAVTITEIPPVMDSVPEIHQAFDIADRVNLSLEEIANIERQEMFIYDQQGTIIKAERDARQEGRQEGRQEEKQAIARQLLDRLDDTTIAQITGLSVQDVQNLRSEV